MYKGHDGGAKCGTDQAFEKAEDIYNSPVTHCFKVVNTGETYLKSIVVTNDDLGFSQTLPDTLAPGNSTLISFDGSITSSVVNTASAKATPIMEDGSSAGLDDVSNSDGAEVVKLVFQPSIELTNTVSANERSTYKAYVFPGIRGSR